MKSYLIEVRGLKQDLDIADVFGDEVVSYRGTWVETSLSQQYLLLNHVVSYRGTWVETNIIHL